ncbi:hypothetical protein B0I35DRAFT_423834 [Stachybotrys elegans]|uniref:Uncharacterized protein n=1 Tax=Stachybotrys elegans TaxID=80388 RepID=A0A8K0ST14_9HYPO|nr:hypothetical protein B0I35DRAFT_423834 [Stachybotrys elegans]
MVSLTFVNTTGAPVVSRDSAKRIRGHITRTNFAKRRQLKAAEQSSSPPESSVLADYWLATPQRVSSGAGLVDQQRSESMVIELWDTMFAHNAQDIRDPEARALWLNLICSDPALHDATMAVGMRHWSVDPTWKWTAGIHIHRAVSSLIQRIASGYAFTDSALAVAMTLAFGERLNQNDSSWKMHIDGAAQMIRQRRALGITAEPWWFTGLLICDCLNYVMKYSRSYDRSIVEAIGEDGNPDIVQVSEITERLAKLRDCINTCLQDPTSLSALRETISARVAAMLKELKGLQTHENNEVRAFSWSAQLLLHLSWQSAPPVDMTMMAKELSHALDCRPFPPCSYMEITSCPLMLGALAAEKGSQTRAWFLTKMRQAVMAPQLRGFDTKIEILRRGMARDDDVLMKPLRDLWSNEIGVAL